MGEFRTNIEYPFFILSNLSYFACAQCKHLVLRQSQDKSLEMIQCYKD